MVGVCGHPQPGAAVGALNQAPSLQYSLFAREGLVDCPAWPLVRTRGSQRARRVARRRRECRRQHLLVVMTLHTLGSTSIIHIFLLCRADPFSKKDWYEVKAPNSFTSRSVGKTLVTRTQGTKVSMQSHQAAFRVLTATKSGSTGASTEQLQQV